MERSDSGVRAFFGVPLPVAQRNTLETSTRALRERFPDLRWVDTANYHITLCFLGTCSSEQLRECTVGLQTALKNMPYFRLALGPFGAFPARGVPRVAWAGLDGDRDALRAVALECRRAATQAGIGLVPGTFHPHVTIARAKHGAPLGLREALNALDTPTVDGFTVRDVSLFQSELRPTGPVYTTMDTLSLA